MLDFAAESDRPALDQHLDVGGVELRIGGEDLVELLRRKSKELK